MAQIVDTAWAEDGEPLHVTHGVYTALAAPTEDGTWLWSVHRQGRTTSAGDDWTEPGDAIKVGAPTTEAEAKQRMLATLAATVEAADDGS